MTAPTDRFSLGRDREAGPAIAVGVALAVSISVPVGIATGLTLLLLSGRTGRDAPISARVRNLAIAVAVGLTVYIIVDVLHHWSEFKAGFIQGWNTF